MKKPSTFFLPAALVGLALLARLLAGEAWESFTRYRTPFAFTNPHARASEALAEGVVIVLLDGLGYDASRDMPFLNELRKRGADFECRVGVPSLSLPGRAVIMTGAWQEIHGQTLNLNPRPLPVEHLFATAKKRGLSTAHSAHADTHRLFAPHVDEPFVYPEAPPGRSLAELRSELRRMGESSAALLRERKPRLAVLELTMTDDAGHQWGAASSEYRQAALAIDDELRPLVGQIDLARTVVIVTADHGHTARGGHGGPEEAVLRVPLVMAGGPLRKGAAGRCLQVDIAPTVAALLGIEIPASSVGRPLLEALTLDAAQRDGVLRSLYLERHNFVTRYVAWLESGTGQGVPADAGDTPMIAPGGFDSGLAELARRQDEAKEARLALERKGRLPALVLFLLPLLALLVLRPTGVASTRELATAVLAAAGALVLYHALFPPLGLAYTFSAMNKDEEMEPFFRKDMILGVACCVVAVCAAAFSLKRRRPEASRLDLARLTWLVVTALCAFFMTRIGFVYWRYGVALRWHLPDAVWGFAFYLDVLVVMALGFAAPVLPLFAFAGAWLGRKMQGRESAEAR